MLGTACGLSDSSRVVDIVRHWAERAPEQMCLAFHDGSRETARVTYGELARQASRYAALFRARGLRAGDPLVLLGRSTLPFVAAFLGAQQADLTAVPCPPPERLESARRVQQRFSEILSRCGATTLFDPQDGPGADDEPPSGGVAGLPGSCILSPRDLGAASEPEGNPPGAGANLLAYCQFTSGSGGSPKGVLLSHGNVLANIRAMAELVGSDPVGVTWLPLFHDMGLVAYVLMPLVLGYPSHVMPPYAFLARPASWLALISRVRGTVAGAPNFAYGLCARKVSDLELRPLDLSCWRVAFNGSEPVTKPAVEAFVRRFAPVGFSPGAMCPSYGLAEDTLCATSRRPPAGARFERLAQEALEGQGVGRLARGDEPVTEVASVGAPLAGHGLAILDGHGTPVADRRIGEVALRGPSVMQGYWAGTAGEVTLRPDGWLLTGDLGYLADGELFVVGRKKDLIIRAGRNYHPQVLEDAGGTAPGVRPGRVAAFSVPGPEQEHVVVVAECQPEAPDRATSLRAAIGDAVFTAVRFVPDDIVLLPPHTIPLTSSGKVMRPEARRLYLEDWRRDR